VEGESPKAADTRITALAGGIGAAKLLLGLASIVEPDRLTIIANTGDDIVLHGLRICPDIDTLTYTLGGIVNEETGWGLAGDTFECLNRLRRYGQPAWFNLGDRDLATHIFRSQALAEGRSLTDTTDEIRRRLGVGPRVLPMTDSYAPTTVITDEGDLHVQEYLVVRKCEPAVKGVRYEGIETCQPANGVEAAIRDAAAVIICPSNPFISIGPVLAVPRIRDALRETRATVAAITPIVGGRALKGPAAAMLRDLGQEVSALGVARLYRDFVRVFVLDIVDAHLTSSIEDLGMRVAVAQTVMRRFEDKRNLARVVVDSL
jgi:LPPG:FO 2-phospho-L-lactate transferase